MTLLFCRRRKTYKDISTETNFYYVKLHGSCNWRSAFGKDLMVIGVDKEPQISREPLLKLYFEIFEHALAQGNRKLLVIGYGFGDSHVNRIIATAVKEHGLRLFVLSPERPSDFREKLTKLDQSGVRIDRIEGGRTIYEGLFGYFPYTLAEVFRSIRTPVFNLIKRSLFPEKC